MAPLYDVFTDDTCSPDVLLFTAPMNVLSNILRLRVEGERRIQRECLSADHDFGCWLTLSHWIEDRHRWSRVLVRGVEARTEEHRIIEQERLTLAAALCPVPPVRPTFFFVLGGLVNGNEGEPATTTDERDMADGWYYLLDDENPNGYGPHPSRDSALEAAARHPQT